MAVAAVERATANRTMPPTGATGNMPARNPGRAKERPAPRGPASAASDSRGAVLVMLCDGLGHRPLARRSAAEPTGYSLIVISCSTVPLASFWKIVRP